jgi:hypothetical protein
MRTVSRRGESFYDGKMKEMHKNQPSRNIYLSVLWDTVPHESVTGARRFGTAWWFDPQGSNVQTPGDSAKCPIKLGNSAAPLRKATNSHRFNYISLFFFLRLHSMTLPREKGTKSVECSHYCLAVPHPMALACYDVFQNSCELMNQWLVIRKGNLVWLFLRSFQYLLCTLSQTW